MPRAQLEGQILLSIKISQNTLIYTATYLVEEIFPKRSEKERAFENNELLRKPS